MENAVTAVDKLSLEESYPLVYRSAPRLRFCELFDGESGLLNHNSHSHSCIELIYYINGKGKVALSEETAKFSYYDAILHPAHKKHIDEACVEKQNEVLCFRIDMPELIFDKPVYLYEHNSMLKHAFDLVYKEAKRENPERRYLEYAIKILMITILRMREQAPAGEQILNRTMEYLKDHFTEKITLEELAALEHISTSYLSRKFKQRTGVTVITYINRLRVEKAQQLLVASSLNINEIAYQTGFDSPKYFYRVFKSVTGESPAGFRRQYQYSR